MAVFQAKLTFTFIFLGGFRYPGNCQSCNASVYRDKGELFMISPLGVQIGLCSYCAEKSIRLAEVQS